MADEIVWRRVKGKDTGHEYSTPDYDPAVHDLLRGKDALDAGGMPIAPVPNLNVGSTGQPPQTEGEPA